MGQYFLTVNLDKREYLNAHSVPGMGMGAKRREHTAPGHAIPRLLWLLLMNEWTDCRIAVSGDEGTNGGWYEATAAEGWRDITAEAWDKYGEELE